VANLCPFLSFQNDKIETLSYIDHSIGYIGFIITWSTTTWYVFFHVQDTGTHKNHNSVHKLMKKL